MSKKKKEDEAAEPAPPAEPNKVGDDQAVAKDAPETPTPAPPSADPPEPVEGPVPEGHCRVHLLGREREFLAALIVPQPLPRVVFHVDAFYERVGTHAATGCPEFARS